MPVDNCNIDNEETVIFKYGDDNANPRFEHSDFAGSWEIKKMYIKESATKVNGITRITLPYKIHNGDVFYVKNSLTKFYIVKWEKFAPGGGHVFQIKRLDGYNIVTIDLNNLTKKTWLQVDGYVQNKQK